MRIHFHDLFRPAFFLLFLGCMILGLGQAARSQTAEVSKAKPMHIEADRVVYGQKERKLEFVGRVHVQRPDFELWCDTMTVSLSPDSPGEDDQGEQGPDMGIGGQVRKIVAQNNVRLKMDQRTATSDRAEFYTQEAKIVLLDNVVLQDKRNTVHGHQVTFWLDEDRSEIEGTEDSRVRAVFYPDETEESSQ
jgi:lipopolysaccharide export system protein LptA